MMCKKTKKEDVNHCSCCWSLQLTCTKLNKILCWRDKKQTAEFEINKSFQYNQIKQNEKKELDLKKKKTEKKMEKNAYTKTIFFLKNSKIL